MDFSRLFHFTFLSSLFSSRYLTSSIDFLPFCFYPIHSYSIHFYSINLSSIQFNPIHLDPKSKVTSRRRTYPTTQPLASK